MEDGEIPEKGASKFRGRNRYTKSIEGVKKDPWAGMWMLRGGKEGGLYPQVCTKPPRTTEPPLGALTPAETVPPVSVAMAAGRAGAVGAAARTIKTQTAAA